MVTSYINCARSSGDRALASEAEGERNT